MEPMIRDIESFWRLSEGPDGRAPLVARNGDAGGRLPRAARASRACLPGETEQKTCRATYRRLCDSGLLSEDDRRRLGKALENSETGVEQVRVQRILSNLIFGKRPRCRPAPPRYLELLDALTGAQSAEVLLVNCMNNALLEPLRQVLEANPAVTARHYFAIGSSESRAAMALAAAGIHGVSAELHRPRGRERRRHGDDLRHDGHGGRLDPRRRRHAHRLADADHRGAHPRAHVHLDRQSAGCSSCSATCSATLPTTTAPPRARCNAAAGPQQFVEMMCLWESCEHKTPMFHMQSDLCINLIDPSHGARRARGRTFGDGVRERAGQRAQAGR